MDDQEMQPVQKHPVVIQKSHSVSQDGTQDRDRADLLRLGKLPVLRVGLPLSCEFLNTEIDRFREILASCQCWVSVALFLPPGKQF